MHTILTQLQKVLIGTWLILLPSAALADAACPLLANTGPIIATQNNQVIENLKITADGKPGILVENLTGVTIRNVRISHKNAHGIKFSNAPNLKIENVVITYDDAPAAGPNKGEFNNIDGLTSANISVDHAKLLHGSSGIYLNRTTNAHLSFIQGEDFRGPFPRGQLVQFNTCDGSTLTDFSVINDRSIAWTEDNVNIFNSSHVTIQRGLVDGNNSPSGVGVIADDNSHFILVEDVDALHQGGGCFSANQIDGAVAVTDVTFNRTRCRDNSADSFANRGKPGSNALAWCAEPRTQRVSVLDSVYYDLAVPYNIGWNWNTFAKIDVRKENFTPRPPIGLSFCWEQSSNPTTPPTLPPVDGTVSYLSDTAAKSATSGYGPYEKDRSNGEMGATDGHPLKLDGKEYTKGLGVHADSDIRYDLKGLCSRFNADIGVDDEVGNNGSVRFHVLADGKEIFLSPTLTGSSATQKVALDITGVKELALKVDNVENYYSDHADWADAKITCGSTNTDATLKKYAASDILPVSVANGYGPMEINQSNGESAKNDGHALTLAGATYNNGLGVHAASRIEYNLNKQCSTFTAQVGLDDEVGNRGNVQFIVLGDGAELYRSPVMTGDSATQTVNANVSGRSSVVLVVDPLGDASYDHADWVEATFNCATIPPNASVSGSKSSFLSDLTEKSSHNGYGVMEKDRSNGEAGPHDGRTLTLAGQTYSKGLGVHANSTVEYNLNGKCSRFMASVGVDDEVGSNGKVQFIVKADGAELYRSPVVTGNSATQEVDVSLQGRSVLSLVVDAQGDANSDHADWADAKIICAN